MRSIFSTTVAFISIFIFASWMLIAIFNAAINLVISLLPVIAIGGIFYLAYRSYRAWSRHKEEMRIS